MKLNKHYSELNESYLFSTIAHKVAAYQKANPDKDIIRLGIGDVTLPLAKSVTDAMLKAVEEQGKIAICTVKRLCAGIGYVNDAQATVTEGNILVNVGACCVRPSMFDSVQHFLKNRIGIVDMVCKTGKSTHR